MVLGTLISCAGRMDMEPAAADSDPYREEIMAWHARRDARLRESDSWLTLAGLFWLQPGANSFGSDAGNALVFPGSGVPAVMGEFILEGDSVSVEITPGVQATLDDSIIHSHGLAKDISGDPDILSWGSLSWYAIQRGDRIGIRLKDAEHPSLLNFTGTEMYAIDPAWRVPARLEPADSGSTVEIMNVLGDSSPNPIPGTLVFELEGRELRLTPLADPGDDEYFIIFGDATNSIETYGAGRFLAVPRADSTGMTVIDFNKAYNMPCVFSPFATCPLPPPQNVLPMEIRAGEKDYAHGAGH